MKSEDRACFNCDAHQIVKIPAERSKPESMYHVLSQCRQKLSDHYLHITTIRHVCSWHSDSVKDDERYPNWKETIDPVII